LKQEAARARDEAQQLARSAADTAQRRGREEADDLKQRAADKAEEIADALDTGADDLEGNGGEALSSYGHSMADVMRRLAGGLREHDIEDFAAELSEYARRNPAVFLAGSVALGFGISRFLKASSSRSHELDQRYELDYDDDYDVEGYEEEEEYEFDTSLEPATRRTADDALQPSPRPEVTRRTGEEPWPRASGDTGPLGSSAESPSPSSSRPSDVRIEGGNDRG
jgi:hypothetical protein